MSHPNLKALGTSLVLVTIWLAVLFVGIFGPDLVTSTAGAVETRVPVAGIVVGFFALIATFFVARYGYGRHDDGMRSDRPGREPGPAADRRVGAGDGI